MVVQIFLIQNIILIDLTRVEVLYLTFDIDWGEASGATG